MAVDVHPTHPTGCTMCADLRPTSGCLEHTCPDCGSIVWGEHNAAEELTHVCPGACAECGNPEPQATGRDVPADDTYEVHCGRCGATFQVAYRPAPTARESADQMRRWARRNVGSCPCECNSGGFCGGCGHAGCGRR